MKIARAACMPIAVLAGMGIQPAKAERISFNSRSAWQEWKHPVDAVELSVTGRVQPLPIRKNIDAVQNAGDFGGGIVGVGSNPRDADHIIDGDPATSWSPDPADGIDKAWIELDLGRLVTASEIVIQFDETASPFEFFNILSPNMHLLVFN